jgi:hypothetical protein
MIEGHLEEIVLLEDDVLALRRARLAVEHVGFYLTHCQENAKPVDTVRSARVLARLSEHIGERIDRLVVVGIPEVKKCLGLLEAVG